MKFRFADNVMGYRLGYAESGKGSKKVLLIHGLGGSAESWTYNIDQLGRHFHVLAPDLIGFGQSEKPPIRYTMDTFARFLQRFMDRVGIRSANLVGSSMGGQIAAELAIRYPSRVERLVLISPAGIPPKKFKGTRELWRYAKLFDARNLREIRTVLQSLDADRSSITDAYVKNVYRYKMMKGAKHAFFSSLKRSAAAPRLANRLRSIRAKTLVIWGREDRLIPVKYCEPFITKMENCRLLIIEGCGHRPHFEKPELFNSIVSDFLKERQVAG